jgi:GNAT superfamily N-acetyltransferase
MTAAEAICVRALIATDHDAWLSLWRGYQTFYQVDIPAETSRVTWTRILDEGEPVFGALGLVGERAVGIVHWVLHRSCWTIGNYCYLHDLFVADDVRGRGLGRKLIEHVYSAARMAGCSRVHWLTQETNVNAMLLYDRIANRSGFIQYRKILT